jgi:hypothetical protein
MFVLLADLLDDRADFTPLLKAIKTARARHHAVHVVLPWPPGIPLPESRERPAPLLATGLQELLDRVAAARVHATLAWLRRELGRAGVLVAVAAEDDSVSRILERIERLRPGARSPR